MRVRAASCLLAIACAAGTARAEPHVLRLATIAPDGTAWARELKTFQRDAEAGASGQLRIKWYFGAIAGDEQQTAERIRRGQLDGAASGGALCERMAPSLRVLRVLGLAGGHQEVAFILSTLRATLAEEFGRHGYALLATSPVGPHILFSRTAIRSLEDLKKGRFFVWAEDDVMRKELAEFGVNVVPLALADAGRAYEEGRVDAFVAPASVALAFQWSAQARFVTDLRMDMISACVVVANRAFDALPAEARASLRTAAATLAVRNEDLGAHQDEQLLGGLFAKQGVRTVPVSPTFAAEFYARAQAARQKLGGALVPPDLLNRVLSILADYRAQNH